MSNYFTGTVVNIKHCLFVIVIVMRYVLRKNRFTTSQLETTYFNLINWHILLFWILIYRDRIKYELNRPLNWETSVSYINTSNYLYKWTSALETTNPVHRLDWPRKDKVHLVDFRYHTVVVLLIITHFTIYLPFMSPFTLLPC